MNISGVTGRQPLRRSKVETLRVRGSRGRSLTAQRVLSTNQTALIAPVTELLVGFSALLALQP